MEQQVPLVKEAMEERVELQLLLEEELAEAQDIMEEVEPQDYQMVHGQEVEAHPI